MRRVLLAGGALLMLACQSGTGTWGGGSHPGPLHAERPGAIPTSTTHLPTAADPEVQADVARAKSNSTCPDIPLTESQLTEAKAGHAITCPAGSGSVGAGSVKGSTTTTVRTPITLTNGDVSAQTSLVVTSTGQSPASSTKRKLPCSRPVFGRCPPA